MSILNDAMDYLADNTPWKTISIQTGSAGVPISLNQWNHEMSIMVFFPLNTTVAVSFHLTKEMYLQRANSDGRMNLLNGSYFNQNDYHSVVVYVNSTGVAVSQWAFCGVNQNLSQAKLIVSYR